MARPGAGEALASKHLNWHLEQQWDVKAFFGAVGDGTTDDTSALQTAVDTALAQSVVPQLYVPPGNYAISSPITVGSNLVIVGAGESITTLVPKSAAFSGAFINYTSATTDILNFAIRDFGINGDSSGTRKGSAGINLDRAQR